MTLLLSLLGLSLLDSTSIGTLVLPVLLVVLARQVRWDALSIYFATVAGLYFAIGLALLFGAGFLVDALGDTLESRPAYVAQLILGVGLFALSWKLGSTDGSPGRVQRLAQRAGSLRSMIGLAVAAVAMEIATMVPYLAAIGVLTASDWGWPARVGALALYCAVMLVPALVALGLASVFGDRMWSRLERFSDWIAKQTEETMAWIVGIVGFFLAADAANHLALF